MNNIECKENFEIKNLTSFKIGGVVDKIYFPKNQTEFLKLKQALIYVKLFMVFNHIQLIERNFLCPKTLILN